jgi:DnaA family protein
MRQVPLALVSELQPSFESYLPGRNAAALAHLRQAVPPRAPIYLWGPPGSGKTHLLRALAHACQAQGLRAGWLDVAEAKAWGLDPGWALVLIDDVHRLDAEGQHAAFALLVDAQTMGMPWAASGDVPPVDLRLRDDLRTRLGWGHTFALEPLGELQTRAVLRREADRRGILLTDDVMDYLLTRFPRDLKSQMELFDRLDAFALALGRAVTIPLLRTMLAEGAASVEFGT